MKKSYDYKDYEEYLRLNDPMKIDYEELASIFERVWSGELNFFLALRELHCLIGDYLAESDDMDTVWDIAYQYIYWKDEKIHDEVWELLDNSKLNNLYDRFVDTLFLKAFVLK